MNRILVAVLPLLLGACAATGVPAKDLARGLDGAALGVVAEDGPGALDYAMVLPENVVWFPWKMVGGTIKGIGDGVMAGFEPERLPILGLAVSPLNAALGAVTGLTNGFATSPFVVGADDDFGDAMGRPMTQQTPIWWYD